MMKKHFRTKQKGLNLVEILLVLTVVTVMLIGGIRQYQFYKTENDISIIVNDVSLLLKSLQSYWYSTCQNNSTVIDTDAGRWIYYRSATEASLLLDLVAVGSLSTIQFNRFTMLKNPFGSKLFMGEYGYQSGLVTSTKINSVPYVRLSAIFDNATAAIRQSIANQSGGSVSGTSISWIRIIQQDIDSRELWVLRSDLEKFRKYEEVGSSNPCFLGVSLGT